MATGRRVSTAWTLLPVFLLGATLRLIGIYNLSPPGLEHDEVANWLIDRAILAGQHAIYFSEAYGHEAAFHYVQAAFVALLGDNALALRLPAAFMGLLGIAVTFVLARQLFGPRIAFISAALVAVLFFPVFFSRLGLRAIMLPLLAGLSAYFWWRGWGVDQRLEIGDWGLEIGDWRSETHVLQPVHAGRNMLIAGALAGLSLHTYMAARALPIFYALFFAALSVLKPRDVRARWRQLLLFWLALAVVAMPLALYLLANPRAEFRISEIDAPLRALADGNVRPVVDNWPRMCITIAGRIVRT
ncbi:MAG TPA: glycosyltransferase family 39 protein, partial [Candidatus Binatia bacterium]|nr:glycosyltransferase family 39 protein [Candidatus Binatia bacterium]